MCIEFSPKQVLITGISFAGAMVLLASCSSGDVDRRPTQSVGRPASVAPGHLSGPPVVQPAPQGQFSLSPTRFLPRLGNSSTLPPEEAACRKRLKRLGVTFTNEEPISEGICGIAHPVKVSMLSGGIKVKPAATLNCSMAETFAKWVKTDMGPAARKRYLSGVSTIHNASSYSCRWIGGRVGGTLSEHGKGNAIDIGKITLDSGRELEVQKPSPFAFRQRGFLNSIRAEACNHFSTVLGPGYDRAHADHFHFDKKPRKNGYVACK